ncbi:MAG TPA: CaiB/BaiF CoA-transferase family protein [Beijerinckiaceae bacterium]|jgi:crotonobetainyl-CoA:carnitine CoA-transferase CaiB-like acyl-CoA transferase
MSDAAESGPALPLTGIRVVEFTQTIMGPCAGLLLADLGADVIKIEPAPAGDNTRRLPGFASGFFGYFNRNKRSLAVNLKEPEGRDLVLRLVADADVVIENFAPGTMERLGCGWDALSKVNPRLVYCACKGFLAGPYEHRPALDEIVQFMGGLAYMTGPPGRPLRAGTSVIDIMGGTFGVVAILAALQERARTGRGQLVKSALFESTVFLMGQHMAGRVLTGEAIPPMPARRGAWGVYEPFETSDDDQIFVGITSNGHWTRFCDAFGRPDLRDDPRLSTNESRVKERSWLIPAVAEVLGHYPKAEIARRCEAASIPYAPVATVDDLFDDPHLNAGALVEVNLPGNVRTKLPRVPVEMDGHDLGLRREAPQLGEHTREILAEIGLDETRLADLEARRIVVCDGGDALG